MGSHPSFLDQLQERLRKPLLSAGPEAIARAEAFLARAQRPCVRFDSQRVSDLPLHRGRVGQLLGRPVATPRLGVLASKFGGAPYVTSDDVASLRARSFLMQINFAEVPDPPAPLPRQGLFCLDMETRRQSVYRWFAVRYYPDPSEGAVVPAPASARCVGSYETALRFTPSVSYPEGEVWDSVMAGEDPAVQEAWSECHDEVEEALGGDAGGHRLGGHKTWMLEDTPFKPPTGLSDRMQDYELLLRLDFDNAADFGWGSNVVYVLVQRDDLAAGRLDRAFDMPANA